VLVAVELVLESGNPAPSTSRTCSTGWRAADARPWKLLLTVSEAPIADTGRYDQLRDGGDRSCVTSCELKELRCTAWPAPGRKRRPRAAPPSKTSRWLIEHLLQAEHTDRHALDQLPDACGQVPGAS
jgi:hypothetical protein